jgi:ubiquinone biosynthesis protein UbiJ
MMHDTEEKLKALRKLGVKFIEFGTDGLPYKVEFFPSADELEKKSKAEEEADTKVNPSTGLTKAQSRDLLGMDE